MRGGLQCAVGLATGLALAASIAAGAPAASPRKATLRLPMPRPGEVQLTRFAVKLAGAKGGDSVQLSVSPRSRIPSLVVVGAVERTDASGVAYGVLAAVNKKAARATSSSLADHELEIDLLRAAGQAGFGTPQSVSLVATLDGATKARKVLTAEQRRAMDFERRQRAIDLQKARELEGKAKRPPGPTLADLFKLPEVEPTSPSWEEFFDDYVAQVERDLGDVNGDGKVGKPAGGAKLFEYSFSGLQISFDGVDLNKRGRPHVVYTYSGKGCGNATRSIWSGTIDVVDPGVPPKLPWGATFSGATAVLVHTRNYKDASGTVLGEVKTKLIFLTAGSPRMGIRWSKSGDIANVVVSPDVTVSVKPVASCAGGGTAPPPTPPTPKTKCSCVKLTATISPKTITLPGPHVPNRFRMEFRLDWEMTCLSGTGGCNGRLDLIWPQPGPGQGVDIKPSSRIACQGDCSAETTGSANVTLFGGPALDYRHRAGKTFTLRMERTCNGVKGALARVFTFVFDKYGFVDKKASDLNADGWRDGSRRRR